jgi:biopolymer transport protein TolR
MAMSGGGGGGGLTNEINVTPMIDVLLVLLIIFMMVIPMSRKAIDLQLPDPTPDESSGPPPAQIVLEVLPGNTFKINSQPVAKADLQKKLKDIYDPRPDKIIFVKGDPTVKYSDVINAMDAARGAGVKVIGMTPKDVK